MRKGCDDAGFRCIWPLEFSEPVKGGAVLIEVSAGDVVARMTKGVAQ